MQCQTMPTSDAVEAPARHLYQNLHPHAHKAPGMRLATTAGPDQARPAIAQDPDPQPPPKGFTMSTPLDPRSNALLAAFADAGCSSLLTDLQPVDMPLGQALSDFMRPAQDVYFPTTSIVSLWCLTQDGDSAEVAAVGREGMVGISVIMGGGSSTCGAVVQSAGQGFRMSSYLMKDSFDRGGPVMHIVLRYIQSVMTQMTLTAVCNRHHSLESQISRWLLQTLDRQPGQDILMTHEMIARALGVRREGVTESAVRLQRAGLIRYGRGRITILNRRGLEGHACECYAMLSKECERLRPLAVGQLPNLRSSVTARDGTPARSSSRQPMPA